MANQGVLNPGALASGRLRVQFDKDIYSLNIDKTKLLLLLEKAKKEKTGGMEFKWMSKERKSDWGTLSSFGGAWAAGAASTGTITVPAGEAWMYSEGDIIRDADSNDPDTNLYIDSVNQSTGVLTCRTFDGSNVDFTAGHTGTNKLFQISNSFELGTGMGTIKSHQPTSQSNYIQIIQTPYGVVETMQHLEMEVGDKEFTRLEQEKQLEHLFDIEKTFFYGQKHKATTGYMNGTYEQYFTGGIAEAVSSNLVASVGNLSEDAFAAWVVDITRYAENPVIFAGEIIFEALTRWSKNKLQVQRSEKTLGMAVSSYLTPYGDLVNVIPHRELLTNEFQGDAFAIDLKDIKYKYLDGEDTHLEVGIQATDLKQVINEYRTWFGTWIGNEKRHGMMTGVTGIV